MLKGLFADKPLFRKFIITGFTVTFFALVFSMIGGLMTDWLYGVNPLKDPKAFSNLEDPDVLAAARLFQLISTGFGMFFIPALLLAYLFSAQPAEYLGLRRIVGSFSVPLSILLMFLAVPLINVMLSWNEHLELPSFLSGLEQWMRESEEQLARLTEAFLRMEHPGELAYNLLIVAVLPALGEELLFRGILQRLFTELTKNAHVAIIVTAAVFSAIHLQFYGFLPRMVLGMLFGYLLLWTGSIWIPIIAHFVNNGAAVVLAYLASRQNLPFDQDTIGAEPGDWMWVAVSIVLTFLILHKLKRSAVENVGRDET
jgi:hypothetical protein